MYYTMRMWPSEHIKAGFCPSVVFKVNEGKKEYLIREYGKDAMLDLNHNHFTTLGYRKVGTNAKVSKIVISEEQGNQVGYNVIWELLQQHGLEITCLLLGLDKNSYGDQYIIDEISMLERLGEPFLAYCNKLAEIDALIFKWMVEKHSIQFSGTIGNLSMKNEKGLSFRNVPFLGYHVETSIRGIFKLNTPTIDIVGFNDALLQFFITHAPIGDKDNFGQYTVDTTKWFDSISLKEHLTKIVGEENATWVQQAFKKDFFTEPT